jgi:DNA-directed RNA polymerase specialized sigma24 family protein
MTTIPLSPPITAVLKGSDGRGKAAAGRGHDPDLWLYRERTLGMLRRYQRLSVEVGRLPSLLGREFFRTRVTSYHAGTFEDAVIFVHDVATGLAQLGGFQHKLIAKIALQDYTQSETARLLGCWRRTVGRRFPEALDRLTEIFLEAGLLIRLPATDVARANNCQGGGIEQMPASASAQRK